MVKRRTLGEGLTPDEEAFLNPDKPVRKAEPKPKTKSTKPKETAPMAQAAVQQQTIPQPSIQAFQPAPLPIPVTTPQPASSALMPLNTRLSVEIGTALLTASMQRKIQRQAPSTQQDIISEALTDWLRKHGFMQ